MDEHDSQRLADALTRLLQGRVDATRLSSDADGWFSVHEVCIAASVLLQRDVGSAHLVRITTTLTWIELSGARIRLLNIHGQDRGPAPQPVPDVLFHATTREALQSALAAGVLVGPQRKRLILSPDEAGAWRVAHRIAQAAAVDPSGRRATPAVAHVDVPRARRNGTRFTVLKPHTLFAAHAIPAAHLLNLRPDFDVQLSAGGIPIERFPDGQIRMALVRVTRRSGRTWEVAKGKLEFGETPEQAASREVQEEMGTSVGFDVLRFVAPVRYGFLAPGGAPRLKTIFLYLLRPQGPIESVRPAHAEGIGEVAWFLPDEAVAAVSHPSLQPVMRYARDLVARFGILPDEPYLPTEPRPDVPGSTVLSPRILSAHSAPPPADAGPHSEPPRAASPDSTPVSSSEVVSKVPEAPSEVPPDRG